MAVVAGMTCGRVSVSAPVSASVMRLVASVWRVSVVMGSVVMGMVRRLVHNAGSSIAVAPFLSGARRVRPTPRHRSTTYGQSLILRLDDVAAHGRVDAQARRHVGIDLEGPRNKVSMQRDTVDADPASAMITFGLIASGRLCTRGGSWGCPVID